MDFCLGERESKVLYDRTKKRQVQLMHSVLRYLDSLLEILKHLPSLQWLHLCLQPHRGPVLFLPLHSLRMQSPCSFQQPEKTAGRAHVYLTRN